MEKSYDARTVESKWYDLWRRTGVFSPSKSESPSYVVVMPPPNVTGVLHNGHALFVTLQDILIRYHRMLGENTLWIPGTDHAGIATQSVVERELMRTENKTRHDIGRPAFLERVWAWKEKSGSRIIEQLQLLGASADWDRCRFTMDEGCSRAVKEAFVRLWNEGLIYRGERLVNWDPATKTALSDEEVDHVTRTGELWKFAYTLKNDPQKEIIVATTRPETMLGDIAVAVHPDDDRYRDLVGQELIHPFFSSRKIKIIADSDVKMDFGTGAVKITPAHDPNDFMMGVRHNLERINILTLDGKINDQGGAYVGFDRFEARAKIKEDLTKLGFFRGSDKIEHNVSVSQRSGVDIEPMLSRQYFVKTKPLADKAYQAVESGETRIIPANWKKTWDHFLLNSQDWCISRQLWWGHQIPVFYDIEKLRAAMPSSSLSDRELLQVALSELPDDVVRSFSIASTTDPGDRYIQEEDVLDTWFSSGLWPFSTLGWPDQTDDLKRFYPSAVLETGFDILFFWVARMMMFGIHFMGQVPFRDVYLHAMVRDAHGNKMSKSLGNAIDPIDLIDGISLDDLITKTKTYSVPPKLLPQVLEGIRSDYADGIPASGADGLRLSLAMLAGQGRDVKLAIPRVQGYRTFLNKIWNATRFSLMRLGEGPVLPFDDVKNNLAIEDRWILSRLSKTSSLVRKCLNEYQFTEAAEAVYRFFWTEFCDWYIELVKLRLDPENPSQTARTVLVEVLDVSMRLLHPFCPFISEEIWQRLPIKREVDFCAIAPFPNLDLVDDQAEQSISSLQEIIVMMRNARQESNLPAQKKLPAVILLNDLSVIKELQNFSSAIIRLANLVSLNIAQRGQFEIPKLSAINANANFEIALLFEGTIDLDAERQRVQKELDRVQQEIASLSARLSNDGFIAKAPAEIVAAQKKHLAGLFEKETKLTESLNRILRGA